MASPIFNEAGELVQLGEQGESSVPSTEATPQAAEVTTPTTTDEAAPVVEEAEGSGIFATIKDMGKGVIAGARNGLQETGETIQWAGEGIGRAITGGKDLYHTGEDGFEWLTDDEVSQRNDVPAWQTRDLFGEGGTIDLPDAPETETVLGGLTEGVSQFVTGYVTFGRHIKVAKAGVAGTAAIQGAAVDAVSFDAHEARMSDFLRDNAGFNDPVTAYLAADPEDGIAEGKLKNALEGLGVGVAAEYTVRLFKALKKGKVIRETEGETAATESITNDLQELADEQPDLFDATTDPNLRNKVGDAKHDGPAPKRTGNEQEAVGEVSRHNDKEVSGRKAPELPPVDVTNFQAAIKRRLALERGQSFGDLDVDVEGSLFNFDKMEAETPVLEYMNMAAESITPDMIKGSETFEGIVKDASRYIEDAIDVGPDVLTASLQRMAQDAGRQQALVVAGKQMVLSLSREVEMLAYKMDSGKASDEDAMKLLRVQSRLVETSANLKSVITGAAQTTSAGRIITTDAVTGAELSAMDIRKQIDGTLDGPARDKLKDLARAIVTNKEAGGGVKGMVKINEARATAMSTINEVYINSILSGFKTHAINALSNTVNSMLLPAEKVMGGALRGDAAMVQEGARQYAGLVASVNDARRMAGIAWKKGHNVLDPEAAILEQAGGAQHSIRSDSPNAIVRNTINAIGTTIRIPGRALTTSDEFFKQLNYRASVYTRAAGEASKMLSDGRISKEDYAKFVADRVEASVGANGAAKVQSDLDYAREATFTQDLTKGSISKYVQDGTNKYPMLKLVAPFVRTPMNILKASLQRTPGLHRLSSTMKADLASGDARRMAQAKGKLVTGGILWTSAIAMGQQGMLTGSGPKDPAMKARLMETGWRPYSYKREKADGGVEYIEYKRMEPFSMFFGIAADVADIAGQASDAEVNELASAALVGLANNLTSKTYLQGLSDILGALEDPNRNAASVMRNYAAAMVPYSALQRDTRKAFSDPYMREVRSTADAVMNNIPGYSDKLPARRSWVTGEPIMYPSGWGDQMVGPIGAAMASVNPIIAGDWSEGNRVLNEMAALNAPFSPPTRKVEGVELDTTQYSRYMELHGTVKLRGKNLMESLDQLMDMKQYDYNRESFNDPSDYSVNPRYAILQRHISKYRRVAKLKLLEEYPELKAQVLESRRELALNKRSLLTGASQAVESNNKSLLQGIADLAD